MGLLDRVVRLWKKRFTGGIPNRIRISNTEQEFITPKPKDTKPILMEKEVRAFLDSILAKNTRKTYVRALEMFEKYMDKTISEIIKERREDFKNDDITLRRRLDRKVERFYVWLINEKGMKPNTAYAYITGIKSIMSFYDVNLKLKIKKRRSKTNDFVPSIKQLREIYEIGNLTEKTIVATATHIPLRINDFNEIKKTHVLPLLDAEEFPVYFEFETRKTKTTMPCFVTEETMKLLRKYIKTLREDNEYLFQGRGKSKLDEDSINRALKNLVKQADIDTRGKRVRFHLFRKVFISVGRNMIGLSDDQIKMLTGKAVKEDMDPYYVNVKLKPWFIEIAKKLRLTGYTIENHDRMDSFEEMLKTVSEVLVELVRPALQRVWLQQQGGHGTLGLMTKPTFEDKEPIEILREFLKIVKENEEN